MKQVILTTLMVVLGSVRSMTYAQEACDLVYDPVCGKDGVTYSNACVASAQKAMIASAGACQTGSQLDQALDMAYKYGITRYNTTADFMPESSLTREQVAKMMTQFAKALNKTTGGSGTFACTFTDLQSSDPTLTNYILTACTQGMMKGWENAFHPQETVSYAQAITMLMRVVDGIKSEGDQWWAVYEQQAQSMGYLPQALSQPLDVIRRGELIMRMNAIYSKLTQSQTMYETWVVADSMVDCEGSGPQQCLQIRRNGGSSELFYDSIQGWNYIPGYEYTLQVIGSPIDNPPADGSSISWSLMRVESYASTNGKPSMLPAQGCDWVKIDTPTLSVWGQTCDTASGAVTISYDDKLPGVIYSNKQLGVTTQIPLVHLFVAPQATGLQELLFETHSSMIKQGLVQKSAACLFKQNASTVGSRVDRYDFIIDTAVTSSSDCGAYAMNASGSNYFVKPKTSTTQMIYINNSEQYRAMIDRSSLLIK